jgi:Poly(ADP-ribose) polymerase catalytic domain
VFGKGVYFAQDFAYSADDRYSKPDKSGLKCVLRCRVLTGQFTVGTEDMIEPPPKPGSPTERFDSTVDDESNPTVFVIYTDYHAYPEYVVTFFSNIQLP